MTARLLFVSLLLLALVGCDDRRRMDRVHAAYLDAVEEHTGEVEGGPAVLEGLPRARERKLEIPPGPKVGVREFFGIQSCGLGEVVGSRNNALGRVMTHSQLALYTVRFLQTAGQCLPHLEPPLKATLQQAIDHKAAHLPAAVYNAIWAGKEMAVLFSVADGALDEGGADRAARALGALESVAGKMRAQETVDLESALAPLQGLRVAGAGLRRVEHARYTLTTVAAALDAVEPDPAWCEAHGAALQATFFRHYVGRVQPQLAREDRVLRPLFAALDRLYRATSADLTPSPALDRFHRETLSDDGLIGRYRRAARAHAAAWRRIFAACDLPGVER